MGLIFKNRASQGGTDIIAVIIRNKNGIKMSTLYFALNASIVLLGVFFTSVELTLYTVLSMFIKSLVIDKILEGFDHKKIVMIITQKEKEISSMIMEQTGRGTTYLYGEGAYSGEQKRVIYCLMTSRELGVVRRLIQEIDPMSIISVSEAEEISGKGFLKPAL
jgi:uncharacterized membrane-anchored protein YitT (DUF2179 family)